MYKLGGMNMSYAIEVNNLVKTYDDIEAVKNISFFVEKDTFFAFLGPNGAGKSTTINIIATNGIHIRFLDVYLFISNK
jgi:ABC-type multidrug transport system ATPase subunit